MKTIILTVQSCGNNKFRLGINAEDSRKIFKNRKVYVVLKLSSDIIIETHTTCGILRDKDGKDIAGKKKGYDLYHSDLNSWLINSGFTEFPDRQPTKLKFKQEGSGLIFQFQNIVEKI